jgi:hypothetical protein
MNPDGEGEKPAIPWMGRKRFAADERLVRVPDSDARWIAATAEWTFRHSKA